MNLQQAKALKKGDLVTHTPRTPGAVTSVYEVVHVSPGWEWGKGQWAGQKVYYTSKVHIQVREVVHMYTTFTESNIGGLEVIGG